MPMTHFYVPWLNAWWQMLASQTHPYGRHYAFICAMTPSHVPWLFQVICAMTPSYVPWLLHMYDSFICTVTQGYDCVYHWPNNRRKMNDSFICAVTQTVMADATFMCAMTQRVMARIGAHVSHESWHVPPTHPYVPWRMHMCHDSLACAMTPILHMCHDSFICIKTHSNVAWLTEWHTHESCHAPSIYAMTHSCILWLSPTRRASRSGGRCLQPRASRCSRSCGVLHVWHNMRLRSATVTVCVDQ